MEGLTAHEILETMYRPGCVDQVAQIVVITKGSRYNVNGGPGEIPSFWPFEPGEILFLASSGREIFGDMRKPGKWDVEAVPCATLAEARQLSEAVRAAEPVFMSDYKESWTDEEKLRWQ